MEQYSAAGDPLALADDALVRRLPARDRAAEAAFGVLYDRYAAAVYAVGMRLLGDPVQAENVLQETFWRLWQHAEQYEPGRVRFGTWLLRIATNQAISELRRAARRPRTVAWQDHAVEGVDDGATVIHALPDPAADVPAQVWHTEQRRLLSGGLRTLPPSQREAVELAYFAGLSHASIAERQGAPLSTVKTRLSLGLQKLANYLAAHGIASPANAY